jgi:hypothetical protein
MVKPDPFGFLRSRRGRGSALTQIELVNSIIDNLKV